MNSKKYILLAFLHILPCTLVFPMTKHFPPKDYTRQVINTKMTSLRHISWSEDGQCITVKGIKNKKHCEMTWHVSTGKLIKNDIITLPTNSRYKEDSPNKELTAETTDTGVKIYSNTNKNSCVLLSLFNNKSGEIRAMGWSSDKRFLLVSYQNITSNLQVQSSMLSLFDTTTWKKVNNIQLPFDKIKEAKNTTAVIGINFNEDLNIVILKLDIDYSIILDTYNWKTIDIVKSVNFDGAWSPNGKKLAVIEGRNIIIYHFPTLARKQKFNLNKFSDLKFKF